MRFRHGWVEGTFLKRENRFRALVEVAGRRVRAHVPNSGRLGELLFPGNRVLLAPAESPGRKTPFDLLLAHCGPQLVSVDARLPNDLVEEALREGRLPEFSPYRLILREARVGRSRFDFLLMASEGSPRKRTRGNPARGRVAPPEQFFIEVKSVTLVEGGTALFPDAPTERGARHLRELAQRVRRGNGRVGAAVLFCVQRPDARRFAPNAPADPAFARALEEARGAGVRVLAHTCRVSRRGVALGRPIPAGEGMGRNAGRGVARKFL